MSTSASREVYSFHDFELDVGAYELRRKGRAVRLERQPMDLLILLVERRGKLVSRDDIVEHLWGKDVFVDVETGVHTAIRKVRQALRDSPQNPAFVETVSGRGYRFIAEVQTDSGAFAGPDRRATREAPREPIPVAPPDIAPQGRGDLETTSSEPPDVMPSGLSAVLTTPSARDDRHRIWFRVQQYRRWRFTAALIVLGLLTAAAIWAWRGSVMEGPVRLAVLPFDNLSGDASREYLADGLTEETIASLGQIDPAFLSVIGRTSSMAYKRTAKSVAQIGRELSVDFLVESSIRSEGRRLRVTSKVIRVRDQVQVWSDSYDREPTSMLGLQQELSSAIAQQIRLRLSPDRLRSLAKRQTANPDAYDLYLRGRNFANQRTPLTTLRAIDYYERATALDQNYALAWAGLAMAFAASALNGDAPPLEVWPRAKDAVTQAIRSNPNLAEAQHASGYVNWCCEWDWDAAESGFRRAVALDPGLALAHLTLGHFLSQKGRHGEAVASMRRARELDPLSAMTHALSSQVAFQAQNYPAALEHAQQAVSLDAEFWIGYMMRAQAHAHLGQMDPAFEDLTNAARFSGHNSKAISLRGYLLAKAGRTEDARAVLRSLVAASRTKYVPPYAMALINSGLGDWNAAFDWLERAVEARDVHLIYLTVDSKWDPIRSDSRFEAILARCGFSRDPRATASH
jgi:TolB-like protein/DNA-binding winged helix-turn-helix (wHTH) protein/Flp pilus assembly protein TadD